MSEHKHKYILQCFHTNIYVLKYMLFVQLTMICFFVLISPKYLLQFTELI